MEEKQIIKQRMNDRKQIDNKNETKKKNKKK